MKNLTRSGIAHNLEVSPYRLTIEYTQENLTYVFSSQFYLNKFKDRLYDNRDEVSQYLSKRIGFKIINNMLSDIKLYNEIEKRGFYIIGADDYLCLNTIRLFGESLI